MDQGCALQSMVGPFSAEMMLGEATKFAVYQWKQCLQRFLVAGLPFQQQPCDLVGRVFGQMRPRFRVSEPRSGRDSIAGFYESQCGRGARVVTSDCMSAAAALMFVPLSRATQMESLEEFKVQSTNSVPSPKCCGS